VGNLQHGIQNLNGLVERPERISDNPRSWQGWLGPGPRHKAFRAQLWGPEQQHLGTDYEVCLLCSQKPGSKYVDESRKHILTQAYMCHGFGRHQQRETEVSGVRNTCVGVTKVLKAAVWVPNSQLAVVSSPFTSEFQVEPGAGQPHTGLRSSLHKYRQPELALNRNGSGSASIFDKALNKMKYTSTR